MTLHLQGSALGKVNSPSVASTADLPEVLDLRRGSASGTAEGHASAYRGGAGILVRGEGQVVGTLTTSPGEQDRL